MTALSSTLIVRAHTEQTIPAALTAILDAVELLEQGAGVHVTVTPVWSYPEDHPEGVTGYDVEVSGQPVGGQVVARPAPNAPTG